MRRFLALLFVSVMANIVGSFEEEEVAPLEGAVYVRADLERMKRDDIRKLAVKHNIKMTCRSDPSSVSFVRTLLHQSHYRRCLFIPHVPIDLRAMVSLTIVDAQTK